MSSRPAGDPRHVLAVDLGTSGLKVGFVSLAGRVAWRHAVRLETRRLPGGGAVQDAEAWWRHVVEASRAGIAAGAVDPEQVVAVGVTGQWSSTVPVDEKGRPVDDCVTWLDTRGGPHAKDVVEGRVGGWNARAAATWIRRTGGVPSRAGNDPVGHMLHLEHDRPDVAAAARWYLEPVDYLTMRCTGVASASHASLTGTWLTDNRRLDVLAYDPELVRMAGVPAAKLPPLVPTGSVVGTVSADAAAELGIPTTARVVTGTPDVHAAAVAAGAVRDHEAHMAISTTSWISCPLPAKKTDVVRSIVATPGLTPHRYLMVNNQNAAGRCLEWLRTDVLGADDGLWPEADGPPGYDQLTALAAQSPPGAGGVLFTPWLSGEISPVDDEHARGGFHNLSLATTRADLVRAVLEGVAANSRWLLHGAERFAGRRLDPIRLLGGGAQSDLWCQILADVLDRTVERLAEPLHAGIRGAALFAAVGIGELALDDVRELVQVDTVFRPDPATRAVYDRQCVEVPKLYRAQKRMFSRLNRRSGTTA